MSNHAAYMQLFDHPRAPRDLLRGFVPKKPFRTVHFDTLQPVPTVFAGPEPDQRRSVNVWRVRVRLDKRDHWLYLVVLLEFQSAVDRDTTYRMLLYSLLIQAKLAREDPSRYHGKMPLVLSVAVHDGQAVRNMDGLLTDMVDEFLRPYQPQQHLLPVDLRQAVEKPLLDNVLYAATLIERGRWAELSPALSKLEETTDPVADADLRRRVAELARQAADGGRAPDEVLTKLKAHQAAGELGAMGSLLAERMDQAVDESGARSPVEAQGFDDPANQAALSTLGMHFRRETLLSDAAVKYDVETATRLEAMLAPIDDPEFFQGLADFVRISGDVDELLSLVTEDIERRLGAPRRPVPAA